MKPRQGLDRGPRPGTAGRPWSWRGLLALPWVCGGPARPVKDRQSVAVDGAGAAGQRAGSARGPRDPGQSLHFSESRFPDVRRGDDDVYHAFLARPRKRADAARDRDTRSLTAPCLRPEHARPETPRRLPSQPRPCAEPLLRAGGRAATQPVSWGPAPRRAGAGGSPLGLTKFGNDSLGLGGRDRGARGTYTARASARGGRGGAQGSPFRLGASAPSSATMTGALAGPGTAGRDRAPARCQAAPPASHPRCCRLETTAPFLQKRKPGLRGAR